MKILVYGINYAPELTGIGKYTGEMCEWLAERGHSVEVITGMPYYPDWKIKEEYKKRWWFKENINGVRVCRAPIYVPSNVSGISRIIHESSFILNSLPYWLGSFFKDYDLVISICPPLQTGILPFLYKLIRRKPFIFHIQDLQVDMARNMGLIQNKFLLNLLEKIEKFILKNATCVSVIGEGMRKKILEKGVKNDQVILLPNWVDTHFIQPVSGAPLKNDLNIDSSKKIILYSGSMGEKQGLEIVLQAAEQLQHDPDLLFILCGEGPAKKRLQNLTEERKICNILFLNAQPYNRLGELMGIADVHLVIQKKAASDLVFPSKLSTILSAGGLAIVTCDEGSDLYNTINKFNLGMTIEPEAGEKLASAILNCLTKDYTEMKVNARKYAETQLSKGKIMEQFENNFISIKS